MRFSLHLRFSGTPHRHKDLYSINLMLNGYYFLEHQDAEGPSATPGSLTLLPFSTRTLKVVVLAESLFYLK